MQSTNCGTRICVLALHSSSCNNNDRLVVRVHPSSVRQSQSGVIQVRDKDPQTSAQASLGEMFRMRAMRAAPCLAAMVERTHVHRSAGPSSANEGFSP